MPSPRILIIGVGNPLLADDGIGHWLVERLDGRLSRAADLRTEADIDLADVEEMRGYDLVFIIDAYDQAQPIGTLVLLRPDREERGGGMISAHGQHLFDIVGIGNRVYRDFPKNIYVIGVQVRNTYTWSEGFTEEVKAKLPGILEQVIETIEGIVQQWSNQAT